MSFTHKIPIRYDFLFPIEHKNNVECMDHLFAYNESKWGSRFEISYFIFWGAWQALIHFHYLDEWSKSK